MEKLLFTQKLNDTKRNIFISNALRITGKGWWWWWSTFDRFTPFGMPHALAQNMKQLQL